MKTGITLPGKKDTPINKGMPKIKNKQKIFFHISFRLTISP